MSEEIPCYLTQSGLSLSRYSEHEECYWGEERGTVGATGSMNIGGKITDMASMDHGNSELNHQSESLHGTWPSLFAYMWLFFVKKKKKFTPHL